MCHLDIPHIDPRSADHSKMVRDCYWLFWKKIFWNVHSSWVRRRLSPKFFRSDFQKMLFGMFVPYGSAGGSAQKFFRSGSQKGISGMFVPLESAGGSAQNFFVQASREEISWNISLIWADQTYCRLLWLICDDDSHSEMSIPFGSAGGSTQNFSHL